MSKPDVIVVGAGIVGMFTALELADSGLKVEVLEQGQVGRQASWAAGGILSPLHPWRYPQPVLTLSAWAQTHYPGISQRLADETGIDPEWIRSGLLIFEPEEANAALRWAKQAGVRCEHIDATQLAHIEPACAQFDGAIHLPDAAQVRNPRLLKSLYRKLLDAGVGIQEGKQVTRIHCAKGRVQGVSDATQTWAAENVIIATGAWTAETLASADLKLPIRPVRGEMLLFRAAAGLLKQILLQGGHYLIPRRDGRIVAGSTVEESGFDCTPTQAGAAELTDAAFRLLSALRSCTLEAHWAGLRPGSPEGIPYIAAHPEIRGLYINAGHFRHGILTAPASARLVADMLLARSPAFDPLPYAWPS